MTKRNTIEMNLPTVDDLFSTQEERDNETREYVKAIPLDKISDFPNHPFQVRMDEKMLEMIESVREYGILSPAVVRPKEDGTYEMISGHRRKLASQMADRPDMPCIVRNLTDDEATIIMIDSNLQREEILPSEKAFAYKMKLDAMKRQAGRPSKNLSPLATDLIGKRSDEILGEQVGESKDQIRRYIRLTDLIKPILDMVDDKKIALRPAVELSYLSQDQQEMLLDTMRLQDCTPSHAQAIKLRKFAEEGRLNEDVILSIMSEEKGNQKEQFRIPRERINKYFSPGGVCQADRRYDYQSIGTVPEKGAEQATLRAFRRGSSLSIGRKAFCRSPPSHTLPPLDYQPMPAEKRKVLLYSKSFKEGNFRGKEKSDERKEETWKTSDSIPFECGHCFDNDILVRAACVGGGWNNSVQFGGADLLWRLPDHKDDL